MWAGSQRNKVTLTLESCKAFCKETVGCVAIDFFTKTAWCNLFDEVCSEPLASSNGASSYSLKIRPGWIRQHGSKRKCENTGNASKQYAGGIKECQAAAKDEGANFISYAPNRFCFYSKTCDNVISRTTWKFSVWQYTDDISLVNADFGWKVKSDQLACSNKDNTQGITRTWGGQGYSLNACKALCEDTNGCVSIDYFRTPRYCSLYDSICDTPTVSSDGASSYFQGSIMQAQQELMEKEAFLLSSTNSSVLDFLVYSLSALGVLAFLYQIYHCCFKKSVYSEISGQEI